MKFYQVRSKTHITNPSKFHRKRTIICRGFQPRNDRRKTRASQNSIISHAALFKLQKLNTLLVIKTVLFGQITPNFHKMMM